MVVPAPDGAAPFDPRQQRLRTERLRLEALNRESDYVRAEPIDVAPGSEPEAYRFTFRCRGVTGIDGAQNPIYGDLHQVELLCDEAFPADVPRLRWVTPIWHPNVQHAEPKGVCVNKAQWLGGMGLDDLCRQLFEMVQYKNYHAEQTFPYPLDQEAARWVREVAEPRGLINKGARKFVDDRPFTRPTVPGRVALVADAAPAPAPRVTVVARPRRVRVVAQAAPGSRIKIGANHD
jgi:ubiquitin-protein ligase